MITRTQRTIVVAAGVAGIVSAATASSGAYFSQSWGWVALAFLVPSTVLVILGRVTAPGPLRVAFASLMSALAAWIALSTIWSLSLPATAREVERLLVYVSVALAIALVLRRGDGPGVTAGVFVGLTGVAGYGLATRLFPDHFDTSIDVFNATRLAEPLGYWNAFGLLTTIGAILAVGVVAHSRRGWCAAVGGASVPLFVVALYLTFSRGSWVALFFGLAATITLDPRRITVLWSLAMLAPAAILGVAYASRLEALTTDEVAAADVAREGHRLAWAVAGPDRRIGASGLVRPSHRPRRADESAYPSRCSSRPRCRCRDRGGRGCRCSRWPSVSGDRGSGSLRGRTCRWAEPQ